LKALSSQPPARGRVAKPPRAGPSCHGVRNLGTAWGEWESRPGQD
jgi:hypothetical protein